MLTPYQYAESSPIENLDIDGLEKFNYRLVLAKDNKTVINIVAHQRFDNWLEDKLHGQVHRIVDPSSKLLYEFEFDNSPELAKFAIGKSVDQLKEVSDIVFQKKVFFAVTYVTAMELEADITKIGNKLSSLPASGNDEVSTTPALAKQGNKDAIKSKSQGKSHQGMEFLDDGLRMKEQPLAPKQLPDLVGFRKAHILNRHKSGAGISDKTEFPSTWSDNKIIAEVNKIANNPNAPGGMGKWNSPYKIGVVDGVQIRVDFYPLAHPLHSGKVSTAYPTNVTPNP